MRKKTKNEMRKRKNKIIILWKQGSRLCRNHTKYNFVLWRNVVFCCCCCCYCFFFSRICRGINFIMFAYSFIVFFLFLLPILLIRIAYFRINDKANFSGDCTCNRNLAIILCFFLYLFMVHDTYIFHPFYKKKI